ncbi:MAG: hypothetical protein NVS9B4_25220 [Candidatus Acidiferrum sp.]
MAVKTHRTAHSILRAPGVRTGLFIGVLLSVVLSGWIYAANRIPSLEAVALERNLIAAVILCALGVFPILRFFRLPAHLLVSSLIAWTLVSFAYRILCLFFWGLSDWHSPLQIFTAGVVLYLIVSTLSWIGTALWNSRAAAHTPGSRHHL